jgi:hypothetical protein
MNDSTPDHVDKTASGNVCRHCGGSVDNDGFSTGGIMPPGTGEHESVEEESQETEQHESGEKMREAAFADAVRRRRPT